MGSNFFIVLDEFLLKFTVFAVSISSFSFFFSKYLVFKDSFSCFSYQILSSNSSIYRSCFFFAIFNEFSATIFFYCKSLSPFSLISTSSIDKWLFIIYFTVIGFLTYFLNSPTLLTLYSRLFCTLFSLNSSNVIGFYPCFLHFSRYWFSIYSIASFLFCRASSFC